MSGNTESKSTNSDGRVDETYAAALARVRRQSRIAIEDAQVVEEGGGSRQEVRLEQNLYVTRQVEGEILKLLTEAGPGAGQATVLVVGEAGHGKTSLLWRLHSLLAAQPALEPWFIKSTLLSLDDFSASQLPTRHRQPLSAREILAAAEAAAADGLEPVVLLDTVDVLLHGGEYDRARLLEFLQALIETGCRLVATCRSQEAILLGPFRRPSVPLGQYEDSEGYSELAEAIEKHVKRFYENVELRAVAEHRQRIEELVARGLPLRDVCVNPLTLRMLFLLYAPNEISPEINIFDLYKKYWDDRVRQDVRAGSVKPAEETLNLEGLARRCSLVMLAEGRPEIPKEKLLSGVAKLGGYPAEVESLVARGVLREQGGGSVSFFHQTFFEHAAARGILDLFAGGGLLLLRGRLESRPNDLFLSPIYEQALLLTESEAGLSSKQGDAFLLQLLESESHIHRNSALYVYAHRREVTPAMRSLVRRLLSTADKVLVLRFLAVAPNISGERLSEVFDEVGVIWERGKWEERAHVLDFLEGLAARDHAQVQAFLEHHDVLDYVLGQPANFQGGQKLLRVYVAVAKKDSGWGWSRILCLYNWAVRLQSRDLQFTIINSLCTFAKVFGSEQIASAFERDTAQTQQENEKLIDENIARVRGRLWATQWQASASPVSSALETLDRARGHSDLLNQLNGLAELLLRVDEKSADVALSYLEGDQDIFRLSLWGSIVLPRVLRGGCDSYGDNTGSGESPQPGVERVRAWTRLMLLKLVTEWKDPVSRPVTGPARVVQDLPTVARLALKEAALPPHLLLQVLGTESFTEPTAWLNDQLLGPQLTDAYLGGHVGATKAMELLANNPDSSSKRLTRAVISRLGALAPDHPKAREPLLRIALKIRDPESAPSVVRTLEHFSGPVPEKLQEFRTELERFRGELLASRSGRDRRSGVSLWINLVRLGLVGPPPLSGLLELISREGDTPTRALLASLIGECAVTGHVDVTSAVEALLPMARNPKSSDVRDKALAAAISIVISTQWGPAAFAMRVLEVAVAAPTDAGRLSLFGRIVERTIPDNIQLAARLVEKLATAPVISDFGTQAKKNVVNRLRSTVRALIRAAPFETRNSLLSLTPSLDPIFQRLIVEAVCHESFAEMSEQLNRIYSQVSEPTQELIRRHKYMRERTRGSGEWIELYELLGQAGSAITHAAPNAYNALTGNNPLARVKEMQNEELQLGTNASEINRRRLLVSLAELCGGDSSVERALEELRKEAGLNERDFGLALDDLLQAGMLEVRDSAVKITRKGINEHRRTIRQPRPSGENTSQQIVQNFYAPVGAVQNAPHSTAEVRQNLPLKVVVTRINNLSDSIARDYELLKEYEDELRLEDDPRRRAKHQREIERLKASASAHEREYRELELQLAREPDEASRIERSELQQIHIKLDALLAGQSDINLGLYNLRQAILSRYDAGEQRIINSITERLDQVQAETVQTILDAVEKNQLNEAEMAEAISVVQQALAEIKQRGAALPQHAELEETISASHLDLKHKLKFSIPIVPLLLEYEGEVELGSGVNLESVWNRLANKFRRK